MCEGVILHVLGSQRQLAELCPPSHSCLGCDPSLTLLQVLAVVSLPLELEQPGWAGNASQPRGFDGERESRRVPHSRMAPSLGAAALHSLGFDVEVFSQGDVPDGFASANGEHQGHHVRVKACRDGRHPPRCSNKSTEVAPRLSLTGDLQSHQAATVGCWRCPGKFLSIFLPSRLPQGD